MAKFKSKVQFIFEGTVVIDEETKEKAINSIHNNIGLVLSGHIHTTILQIK